MNKISPSFINNFGYSSATRSNYNWEVVKQQLRLNQPVILSGGRNTGWWIFNNYSDGHAWVSDGFLRFYTCGIGSSLYLHMNWGWGDSNSGSNLNGWYAFNNWNPGTHTFNYNREMIYNIKP